MTHAPITLAARYTLKSTGETWVVCGVWNVEGPTRVTLMLDANAPEQSRHVLVDELLHSGEWEAVPE